MGLKDMLTILRNYFIVSLVCFTLLCSAAPARQAQNREVMSWLEVWTEQLGHGAYDAYNKYNDVHFSHRENDMPTFRLPILRRSLTRVSDLTPQNISEAICRQLMEFTGPVYLALYDESQRGMNSDTDLTKLLLNLSVTLNSTLEMARYLHVRNFPNAKQTQVVKSWTRNKMSSIVLHKYKIPAGDPSSINELRSWATMVELKNLQSKLSRALSSLYRHI